MGKLILRSDNGPDLQVDDKQRKANVDIVCGKTGKAVGHCSLYLGRQSLAIYYHDRRRKAGHNRGYYIFPRQFRLEDVLAVTGQGYEFKDLLRRAGFDGPEVTMDLDNVVVSREGES